MSISVSCPDCQQAYNVPDDKAGKKFRCKQCQAIVEVPGAQSEFGDVDPFASLPTAKPTPERRSRRRAVEEDEDPGSDDDDDFDQPRRRNRRSRRGRGKSGRLAGLGQRFLARLIDNVIYMVMLLPGAVMIVLSMPDNPNQDPTDEQMGVIIVGGLIVLLGAIVYFGLFIYLQATRSQSPGKYIMQIQIWDYNEDAPASLVQTWLIRSLAMGAMVGALNCCYLGWLLALVDICMIFGDERRCMHDMMANTYVVDIS